jgi:hypothetical protein
MDYVFYVSMIFSTNLIEIYIVCLLEKVIYTLEQRSHKAHYMSHMIWFILATE